MKLFNQSALAILFGCALCTPVMAAQTYSLTNLGDIPGAGTESRAFDINASGAVVGEGWADDGGAFLWNEGTMTNLGSLPGGYSSTARGVNSSNHVVGFASKNGGGDYRAFIWDAVHGIVQLGGLPGETFSGAYHINNAGRIVGESWTSGPSQTHAVVWTAGSPMDIGTLGGPAARANDINDAGQVVGFSFLAGGSAGRAFMYDGTMHDLGVPTGELTSYGAAINNSAHVAGWSENLSSGPTARYHASFYDGVTMHDIGVLLGKIHAQANDLNDFDQIVGWSSISTDGGDYNLRRAFLYDRGVGLMTDLNDLVDASAAGWTLLEATAINNAGQITGIGLYDADGTGGNDAVVLGFRLTAVPEPTIGVVLTIGCLVLKRSHRKHSRATLMLES